MWTKNNVIAFSLFVIAKIVSTYAVLTGWFSDNRNTSVFLFIVAACCLLTAVIVCVFESKRQEHVKKIDKKQEILALLRSNPALACDVIAILQNKSKT